MNTVLAISPNNPSKSNNLQNDLRVFTAHGVYGKSIVSAFPNVTEDKLIENQPIDPQLIKSQINVAMENSLLRVWKVGELSSIYSIKEVSDAIRKYEISSVIFQPVLSNNGNKPYDNSIVDSLVNDLLPLSRLIVLTKETASDLVGNSSSFMSSRMLAQDLHDIGANGVLIVDLPDENSFEYVDVFLNGGEITEIRSPVITHSVNIGLSSTFSASIAAHLSKGMRLEQAVQHGREYLTAVLASSNADPKYVAEFGLNYMLGKVAIENPATTIKSLSDTSGEIATLSKYMDILEENDLE